MENGYPDKSAARALVLPHSCLISGSGKRKVVRYHRFLRAINHGDASYSCLQERQVLDDTFAVSAFDQLEDF